MAYQCQEGRALDPLPTGHKAGEADNNATNRPLEGYKGHWHTVCYDWDDEKGDFVGILFAKLHAQKHPTNKCGGKCHFMQYTNNYAHIKNILTLSI